MEADNMHYNTIIGTFERAFEDCEKITGRHYEIVEYYGASDATDVIVVMGSGCLTVAETIDYLRQQGKKVGAIFVRLFRPFPMTRFVEKLPESVKRICVLDRCKEVTASAEPLRLDVV